MDEPKRPQPRRVDGPVRATPVDLRAMPQPHSADPVSAEVPEAKPVFEYKKPQRQRRRLHLGKKVVLAGVGLVVVLGIFLGAKFLLATSRIITRNSTGGAPALAAANVDPTKLNGEGDGRVNILLLGIGGAGHDGGNLSDTMMVISIDPKTKDVAMLSIPRDLYVPIPGYGTTKINAANAYGEANKYPGGGPALAKATVSKVLDIPIHYYAMMDFEGFRKAVNQVGGIDVVNQYTLSDTGFPCDDDSGRVCPYYLAAGSYHLDGTQALRYVRCREGTCGTNFGREDRQRQALVALRQKALGLSTLSNPAKIASLIDIVGSHIRTDLQISEMARLATIMKDMDPAKIITKGLGDYTYSTMIGGASVVVPKTGVGNFTQIRDFVHSIFIDNYIKSENAAIEVQNGSSRTGLATTVGTSLRDTYKYNVVSMTTADNQNYPSTIIYDYSGGKKPYTLSYLETRFKVKARKATAPTGETADIRIIIGADYVPSSSN